MQRAVLRTVGAHLAAFYGCAYEHVDDLAAVGAALGRGGTRIVEVRTDRAENLALHRRATEAALGAIA